MKPILIFASFLILSTCLWAGCSKDDSYQDSTRDSNNKPNLPVFEAAYDRHNIESYSKFSLFDSNLITHKRDEISGIASSRLHPGLLYMHEDSGNPPALFVYNQQGVYKGLFRLSGINNRDWEDIAIGPGPVEGVSYIYVGDIGDNNSTRGSLRIYRFPEPSLPDTTSAEPFVVFIDDFDIIEFEYPDGPRDAEALMINPQTKELIVITKKEPRVHVYSIPFPQSISQVNKASFRGYLPLRRILAGDIAPDGSEMVIKNDGWVYHWYVQDQDPVKTMFHSEPKTVAYIQEVQGESLGWDHQGKGYFTITETKKHGTADPILYYYTVHN